MAVVGVAALGGADLEVDGSRDRPLADRIGRAEEILATGPAGRVTAGRLGRAVSDVVPLDRLLVIATRSDEGGDAGDTDGLATLYRNHSEVEAIKEVVEIERRDAHLVMLPQQGQARNSGETAPLFTDSALVAVVARHPSCQSRLARRVARPYADIAVGHPNRTR